MHDLDLILVYLRLKRRFLSFSLSPDTSFVTGIWVHLLTISAIDSGVTVSVSSLSSVEVSDNSDISFSRLGIFEY